MNAIRADRATAAMLGVFALFLGFSAAHATDYADAVATFKQAGESRRFFDTCYGYAIFPTVGEAGFVVGAAIGKGRVYSRGRLVGDTTMMQISAGLQAGGKAYSQIIFFEDKRALDEFESGSFEFEAGMSAVAITAAAGASGTERNATVVGAYNKGLAVFTIAKGGLMYAATLSGQRYSYKPRG